MICGRKCNLSIRIFWELCFFAEHYKFPIERKQDENSLAELKTLVSPFILRRTKEQVLKDLPELSEQVFYCEMEPEQEKLYEEEKSKARNALLKTDGSGIDKINIINTLMRLRQLSNHPKMVDANSEMDSGKYMAVTRYLETLVQSNQKTIVFSSFVSNLEFYKKWSIENKIDFVNSRVLHLKKNAPIKFKISRTRALKIVFHFLKSRWCGAKHYQSVLCFVFGPLVESFC